jgi:UDP-N-acetyl-D-mannosaminuronate dehydrogenase
VSNRQKVVVVGMGEVGKPLLELLSKSHDAIGVDITPPQQLPDRVDVLHICYPFEIKDFLGESERYINMFQPEITIINSTVAVGTTRAVAERTSAAVVNSPVRGKHVRMLEDMGKYSKFVGALDAPAARKAAEHFASAGLKTTVLSCPEATELAKLTETTYFGVLIAWAQEVERYCDKVRADYSEVTSFYDEIKFFPSVKYFPGVIGGHCVMPNIEILSKLDSSPMLTAIKSSNCAKINRDAQLAGGKAAGASLKK